MQADVTKKPQAIIGSIGLYKFIFALVIAIHHLQRDATRRLFSGGGYLPVSFFFIVTGYLMCRSLQTVSDKNHSEPERLAYRFWIKRVLTIYPHYLFSMFVTVVMAWGILHIFEIDLLALCSEALLFHAVIPVGRSFNHATWFLSAMLATQAIYAYLYLKDRNSFLKLTAPILSVLMYGAIFRHLGNLNVGSGDLSMFLTNGMCQALAGLGAGAMIFQWGDRGSKQWSPVLATIVEFGCVSVSLWYCAFYGSNRWDFAIVALFIILIYSSFHNESYITVFTRRKFFVYLQDLSLSVYLNHAPLQFLCICRYGWLSPGKQTVLFIVLVLMISGITAFFQNKYLIFIKRRLAI